MEFEVPNRLKSLLWRAILNSLPSWTNLFKRKVLLGPLCQCCGSNQETIHHAIWSCPALATVWNEHFSCLTKETSSNIQFYLERSSFTDFLAMTTALICMRTNKLRVGEPAMPLDKISSTAMKNLQEFQRSRPIREIPKSVPCQDRWKPPRKD